MAASYSAIITSAEVIIAGGEILLRPWKTRTHCCPWCFLGAQTRRTQNECCCDTKCFWTKSETIFASRTQNLCAPQMPRARANGETSELATMCPRLPGPLMAPSRFVDVPEEEIKINERKCYSEEYQTRHKVWNDTLEASSSPHKKLTERRDKTPIPVYAQP